MNTRVEKKLFDEMFLSCAYGFESMKTVSQNWLADVTGQLKTTCTTLGNTVAFWGSARLDQLFQKSFIIFYLDLFYSFPTFFQTALQTLELLLFLLSLWLSMTSLTSLQFFSISSSVLLIKAAIELPSSLSSSSLSCPGLFGKKMSSL